MISASTWFDPYVLEVLEIPIAIIIRNFISVDYQNGNSRTLIHVILSFLFYMWVWVYFYSSDSSQFFAIHMNDFESYIIEIFFIGITCVLSWSLVKARKF